MENKKVRFNAIDALIILLVIALLVGIAYRAVVYDENAEDAKLKEYTVYFKVESIRNTARQYFVAGDIVRMKSTNQTIGVFDSVVQHDPAVGAYNDKGGQIFYPEIENPDIYNDTNCFVIGYITVKGEMTDSGFLLNGDTYISSNSDLEIVTDHIETTIKIISITEK